jgi:phosphatidylinositol kinase/protein kinase (PI-3  family)
MNLRLELVQKIGKELVPETLLLDFIHNTFAHSSDQYWLFRRLFTQQFALTTFISYVMAFGHRTPGKYALNLGNGQVTMSEVLPSINNSGQIALLDAVPFRLTPNLQVFMGPALLEGIFVESIRATASIFGQVEKGDLGLCLPLFLRDELAAWLVSLSGPVVSSSTAGSPDSTSMSPDTPTPPSLTTASQPSSSLLEREAELFNSIASYDNDFCATRIKPNIELFNKRLLTLACVKEAELAHTTLSKNDDQIPPTAHQAINDLISCATNPQKLALMDPVWQPWF